MDDQPNAPEDSIRKRLTMLEAENAAMRMFLRVALNVVQTDAQRAELRRTAIEAATAAGSAGPVWDETFKETVAALTAPPD